MISFVVYAGYPGKYKTISLPGILKSLRSACSAATVTRLETRGNIFDAYHRAVDELRGMAIDALVLMHDDLEFRDPELYPKIVRAMSDPSVAIAGLIGSRGGSGISWWTGQWAGRITDDANGPYDFGFSKPEVDKLDGMCLILSPWAVQNLSLRGLGYEGLHGYADELCAQVIANGKKVVVVDIDAHHHSKGGYAGGVDAFNRADAHYRARWPQVETKKMPIDEETRHTITVTKLALERSIKEHYELEDAIDFSGQPPTKEQREALDASSDKIKGQANWLEAHGVDPKDIDPPREIRGRRSETSAETASEAYDRGFSDGKAAIESAKT